MPYYTYNMNEKVEMNGFDTLEEAHRYCKRGYYPMYIIWEGDIEEDFRGSFGEPLAMYIKGKLYNISPDEG